MDLLRTWPPKRDRYLQATIETADAIKAELVDQADGLRTQLNELRVSTKDALEQLRTESTARANAISDFAQVVETKKQEIGTEVTRIDAALADLTQKFEAAETARQDQFAAARDDIEAKSAEALADQSRLGQAHIEHLNDLENQARLLVDAVGLTATATEYGRHAEEERKVANLWRRFAAAGFAGTFVLFIVMLVIQEVEGESSWTSVIGRFGGSLALLAFALYAAHESNQHRAQERIAKSNQLDLAALDPFVATLPEEKRHDIKGAAARRLFSSPEPTTTDQANQPEDDGLPEPVVLLPLLRQLVSHLENK